MNKRPIVIDLFAGAGGLSLGFEQAGFDVVAAIEIDPIHAATHKFNFPDCAVIPQSVTDLSGAHIRTLANLSRNEPIDVVIGGAPCQGFSLIGQRALEDPRNCLVKDFLRLVTELESRYFVFENVKGLTIGKHRQFLDELVVEFERAGYNISNPWQVLNAREFGIPQNRERLFLLGSKKGLQMPVYPEKSTQVVTCHDALNDLPNAENFEALLNTDEVMTTNWGELSKYAELMRPNESGAWHFGHKRKWNRDLLTSSLRTSHTEVSRNRFSDTVPGTVEPISRFFRLLASGQSNTLRAGTDSARGAFTSPRPIHYKYDRCVTVREMARLHGFPDWFRFHKTKWHGARQIGNAVPPPLAMAVASKILNAMDIAPAKSREILALGDSALLKMDMSNAAQYWGVDNPIAKRNRKNGLTRILHEGVPI